MNVADFYVRYLAAAGVTHIFGYPGSPLLPLLSALERQTAVQWVLMRHENAAAMAASAYAKATGRLGVCVATSGPGALNLVCGVTDAHLDRVPLLALTGLVPTTRHGHWEFQDIDQTSLFRTLVGHSATAMEAGQAVALLRNAVGRACHQHQAVHLALPQDVLSAEIDAPPDGLPLDSRWLPLPPHMQQPAGPALDAVAAALERFERIVIVAGRRALGSGAAIGTLARKLGAPMLTSLDGKGVVDEDDELCAGVLGVFGFPAVERARQVVTHADAVVAFGVDTLKPFVTNAQDVQCRDVIQVEDAYWALATDYRCAHTLVGPMDAITSGLIERVRRRVPGEGAELLRRHREPHIHEQSGGWYADAPSFLRNLSRQLPADCTIAIDTGAHTLWAAHALRLRPGQRVLVSSRLGTMGYSLPAAIAAQLARPDEPAIALCGDGGLQMVLGELATAVQYRLPIVVVVFNNGLLHNVAAQQAVPYGTVLHNPDFAALARAFGAEGVVVDGTTNLVQVVGRALAQRDRPLLIDLRCDPSIAPPLSTWNVTDALADEQHDDIVAYP